MKEPQPTDLLSSLPRTRPHRRSAKRPAAPQGGSPAEKTPRQPRQPSGPQRPPKAASHSRKPASAQPKSARVTRPSQARLGQPAQPRGTPAGQASASSEARKSPPSPADIVGTAVGAAAELAEIGLTLGTRALRRTLSRLPRP